MENVLNILSIVLVVLGSCVVALKAVAPLTGTTLDDKLLSVFTKLHDLLARIVGPKKE